ncbi:MAG: hypothetical protein J6W57_02650 [Oscillospiraceae bacterium]|nr:hypothetical protein [Oscillospiraceae bacterium]MBQ5342146.1 hypothetical protein [Oscillospiraceae bacterium]
MRIRALKILSIVFAVMGALSLLLAAFFRQLYYGLMDGSSAQYARIRSQMNISFIAGIILMVCAVLFYAVWRIRLAAVK